MNRIKSTCAIGLAVIALGTCANASVIVTYAEDTARQLTTLSNASVFTFDALTANKKYTNLAWSGVGTFDSIYIKSTDQYGGATNGGFPNGSPYAVESTSVGSPDNVVKTTLSLTTPVAYFGFWWSAGDAFNVLDFYSGATLVAEFTTDNLMKKLPQSYYGNPKDRSLNSGEPYAFINFFGAGGSTWDQIQFSNDGSSGFEADNYTVRTQAYGSLPGENANNLPGIPVVSITGTTTSAVTQVPEPNSLSLLIIALLGLSIVRASQVTRS
jgi:hypothetical protein